MALTYNLTNIKNFDTVCYFTNENGENELRPLTHALIFGSMLVEMPEITEENCVEFFGRITIMARLYDAFLQEQDTETGFIRPKPYTLEMIRSHIGLKTNASNYSRKEWLKVAAKKMQNELDRLVREYASIEV